MQQLRRQHRHTRLRAKVKGTAARPRVSVFRSARSISLQFIDDFNHQTLLAIPGEVTKKVTKLQQAAAIGKDAATQAKATGITKVVFDRAGYKYHGRVKAVAEALRAGGLDF